MTALAFILAAFGVLLVWSAWRGQDPRAVLRGMFS